MAVVGYWRGDDVLSGSSYPLIESCTPDEIRTALTSIVDQLQTRPEFAPIGDVRAYELSRDQGADVKVAVADCSLDFDLWGDLRNPAGIGLHPIGLSQLWEFWAHHTAPLDQQSGFAFRVPESYERACERFGRAIIISVMLPISRFLLRDYYQWMGQGRPGSPDMFHDSVQQVASMLDRAVCLLPQRMDRIRPIVALSKDNVKRVSELTVPVVQRGDGHGPGKGGNFPQKSVAVLTGLGQFGAHRLVMRDEIAGGRVERYLGPIRTVVVFDSAVPGSNEEVPSLTGLWRKRLQTLFSGQPDELRICRHYDPDPDKRCSACIEACPPGAVASSLPAEQSDAHKRRMWNGQLQFDSKSCTKWRHQLEAMYGSWACVRCLTACAVAGKRDRTAAEAFVAAGEELQ